MLEVLEEALDLGLRRMMAPLIRQSLCVSLGNLARGAAELPRECPRECSSAAETNVRRDWLDASATGKQNARKAQPPVVQISDGALADGVVEAPDESTPAHARETGKILDTPGACWIVMHCDQAGVQFRMGEPRQKPRIGGALRNCPAHGVNDDDLAQMLADKGTPAPGILLFREREISESPKCGVLR